MSDDEEPKQEDIGWNRFADFVDSLSYCLSKYEGTKDLLKSLSTKIETNRNEVSLGYLLDSCKNIPSLEKAFEQFYGLIYGHEKYEKMFVKQELDLDLDKAVTEKYPAALFLLSRIIRNHKFTFDDSNKFNESNLNFLRKAFMYRSMCNLMSENHENAYKDYLFSIIDYENDNFDDDYFILNEEDSDSLKAYLNKVKLELNSPSSLSLSDIVKYIPKLKEICEQIRRKNEPSTSSPTTEECLFVSDKIQIAETWKNKGRAFVSNADIQPRTRLFEETPISHIIYDIQRRCECCGKQLIPIQDYDSSTEQGNGSKIVSFFPSFSKDSLIYCDLKCASNNLESVRNSQLRPLLFELGVASLPLKRFLHDSISTVLSKWKEFNENPEQLKKSSKNDYLVFKLMNHISEHDKDNLASYALATAFVTYCFEKHFNLLRADQLQPFGECFLHQLLSLSTNVITIQDQLRDKSIMIGVGIYPTIAILNHSCKPNVVPIFSRINLIIEASSPIDSGHEVLYCYDTDLKNMKLKERQTYFRNNYFFDCDCVACVNDQKDYSKAIYCNFKTKESNPCRKVAFIQDDKVVCENKPPHEVPVTQELLKTIENIEEKYKYGNRMTQIFEQSNEADDATEAFLSLNDAAKLAQQYLYPLNELSVEINLGMVKIYNCMGHYSRAMSHSEYLINTFRKHRHLVWSNLQSQIAHELYRFLRINLLEFQDNTPSRGAVEAFMKKVDSLEEEYGTLKYELGEEAFNEYYSGSIEKLDELRKEAQNYL